ncbi:hypothetical protein CTAYLR_008791 [Chrysophaeum taylorii]|uniref:Uncharacterized protein n=1 Tax=Chrysophaeum taylorii TaxID=2483200 RepID=A0AAD7UPG2_9STRA|nr:hypothetical protein CTAYLR_008791 [Chrysophaeum taylorii]
MCVLAAAQEGDTAVRSCNKQHHHRHSLGPAWTQATRQDIAMGISSPRSPRKSLATAVESSDAASATTSVTPLPEARWARTSGGRLRRKRGDENSAVHRVWSRAALVESLMHASAITLDARDLARLSCVCRETYGARWPWPCPFLRCSVPSSTLDEVPRKALVRLASALELPRRFSKRLSPGDGHILDGLVGRAERSFRSALAISVVAHCSAANRRAVGQTGAVECLIDHLAIDDDDDDDTDISPQHRRRRRRRRRRRYAMPDETRADDYVPRMRSAAARALCQLARELQCRNTIRDKGGIERLVAIVRNDDNRVEARGRDKAAQAIANMAARDDAAKLAIAAANAIPALVELLDSHLNDVRLARLAVPTPFCCSPQPRDRDEPRGRRRASLLGRGAENAAAALSNLAADRHDRRSPFVASPVHDTDRPCPKRLIVEAGALPLLARLLERGALRGRENAAGALANLAGGGYVGRAAAAAEIVRAGAVPPLVAMVSAAEDGERITERAREKAAAALRYLTHNHAENRAVIVQCGALAPLVRLATRVNAPQKARQHAVQAVHQLATDSDDSLRAVLQMPGGPTLLASIPFFEFFNDIDLDPFLL